MGRSIRSALLAVLTVLLVPLPACGGEPADAAGYTVEAGPADSMGPWVTTWLEGREAGEGFQYFVYSDPDSWDIYLWCPGREAEVHALAPEDIRLEIRDSVLQVYLPPVQPVETDEIWLIHIAAPLLGPWPTGAALYWEVPCDGSYYEA